MSVLYRTADSKGRVTLPDFANAPVILEKISETEYRVRKARVVAEADMQFYEKNFPLELSARDAAAVAEALENPPPPNKAARRAAKRFKKKHD